MRRIISREVSRNGTLIFKVNGDRGDFKEFIELRKFLCYNAFIY